MAIAACRPPHRGCAVLLLLALAVVPVVCSAAPVGPRRKQGAPYAFVYSLLDSTRIALPASVAQDAGTPLISTNSTDVSVGSVVPLVPFPDEQPPQTRQQIMSFLLYNSSTFDVAMNNATLYCLSIGTGTDAEKDWGLWAYKRFTSNMIQLEYFCNVPDAISDGQFSNWLRDYVNSGLTDCVLRQNVGLNYGKFFIGRETEERQDLEHESTEAGNGSPPWVPGLIIGLVGCVCLIGALVLAKEASGTKYNPSDYDDVEQDPAATKELSSEDELRMMADGT